MLFRPNHDPEALAVTRTSFAAATALALAVAALAQQPAKLFDGNAWWAHIKFLADDKLEGRETGSQGLRAAEAYVVDQLTKAGLQPAGSNGFYLKSGALRIVDGEAYVEGIIERQVFAAGVA